MFAAVGDADFLVAGDFFGETHAAGAVDAAAHFLGGTKGPCLCRRRNVFPRCSGWWFCRSHRQILQLAFAALVAGRTIKRMVDEQELHHAFLRLSGFCPNAYAQSCRL